MYMYKQSIVSARHISGGIFADSAENGSADQTEPDADQFEDAEMDE